MSQRKERRRSPRVKAQHNLVLKGDGDAEIRAQSVDLNLGGIYCELDRHIPLFTKLGVQLTLPLILEEGKEPEEFAVSMEGVVVRVEPEEPQDGLDAYACAMAFVNMDPDSELIVARYLLQAIAFAEE
jgi:c-di-GMP-binding flagellar brake protein YcgR